MQWRRGRGGGGRCLKLDVIWEWELRGGFVAALLTSTGLPTPCSAPFEHPAYRRVSVRRLEGVVFDACQELFPTKFTGTELQLPLRLPLLLTGPPPTPSHKQTVPEQFPGF